MEEGVASYYADPYHGRKTSNGETYDMYEMTAAHQTLPFNTKVKVTNLDNQKTTVVRINDRGPFAKDRIIDLSVAAAREIDMIGPGTARVRLEVIELGREPKK
ncbi:MAG: septal ring lytic transglycosylase RlpA family protein [Bacteroidetes bacterium]|nr:MAG: septal ring lytic transglycosylase RlpA family protein [Bacteroidota bacterium]